MRKWNYGLGLGSNQTIWSQTQVINLVSIPEISFSHTKNTKIDFLNNTQIRVFKDTMSKNKEYKTCIVNILLREIFLHGLNLMAVVKKKNSFYFIILSLDLKFLCVLFVCFALLSIEWMNYWLIDWLPEDLQTTCKVGIISL